jgi:hypothetical protein
MGSSKKSRLGSNRKFKKRSNAKLIHLSPDRVLDWRPYHKADPESFDFLFQVLRKSNFRLLAGQEEVYAVFPQYDKLFWRTDINSLIEGVTKSGKIPAGMLVHQAVHTIFNQAFAKRSGQEVGLVLLAESFATAMNFYFLIQLLRSQGASDAAAMELMKLGRFSKVIKRKFLKTFHNHKMSSKDLYLSLTGDIWRTYQQVLEWLESRSYAAIEFNDHLLQFINALDHPWLPASYDLANNIFYAKSQGWSPSISKSMRQADQVYQKLCKFDGSLSDTLGLIF